MQLKLGMLTMLLAVTAQAGFTAGVYEGVDQGGAACSFTAGAQTFENNAPHPLNERISAIVGQDRFQVYHPRTVDAATATVDFNHDLLEAVAPHSQGSKALVIEMIHSDTYEGPGAYTLINDNWKTGEKSKVVCSNLKLKE